MKSDFIEDELKRLLGELSGPPGLVLTLRRHDEYELLLERIQALERENKQLNIQVHQMSRYASMYLQALDDLKLCRKEMIQAGLSVSWIRSLKK